MNMALTLYAIGDSIEGVLRRAEDNGGEFSDEDVIILDSLAMAESEKLGRCGYAVLNIQAEVEAFDEEVKRLTARRNTLRRKAAGLKDYVFGYMQRNEMDCVEEGTVRLKICKSAGAVKVMDEGMIPDKFYEPQPPKLLKSEMQRAIKEGAEIPGVVIQQGTYLKIS